MAKSKQMGYVYQIRNKKNGKVYIGQTLNFRLRQQVWIGHFRSGHGSKALQADWDKHGEKIFEFKLLGTYPEKELTKMREYFITQAKGNTYNKNKLFKPHYVSDATKAKIGKSMKKRWADPKEHKQRTKSIRAANDRRSKSMKQTWTLLKAEKGKAKRGTKSKTQGSEASEP